jgi:glycosyltransferase involved in cell wall biosynthesis
LADALAGLQNLDGLFLLSVGFGRAVVPPALPHRHLGKVACDAVMRIAYRAADVFAMPSTEESFGQTVVESMACGTPVVAFAVGGMLDTVRPGLTGILAAPGSAAELGAGIESVLTDDLLRARLSAGCRRVAVEEYSSERQARRYVELYDAVLTRRSPAPALPPEAAL